MAVVEVAATAAQMKGAKDSADAMESEAVKEQLRQRELQKRKADLADLQEQNKQKGVDTAKQSINGWNADAANKDIEAAKQDYNATYNQPNPTIANAAQGGAPASGGGGASDVQTVTDSGSDNGLSGAFNNALSQRVNLDADYRLGLNNSKSFLNALDVAQRLGDTRIMRGGQGVDMYNNFIAGIGGQMGNYENLQDASNNLFQVRSQQASHAGDAWSNAGKLAAAVGQAGYGMATAGKAAGTVANGAASAASVPDAFTGQLMGTNPYTGTLAGQWLGQTAAQSAPIVPLGGVSWLNPKL